MKFHGGIPGWFDFPDFYDWVVAQAPMKSRFVEVGALFGASTVYLQQRIMLSGKDIRLEVVDSFDMMNLSLESRAFAFPFGGFRSTFDTFTKGRLGENVSVRQMRSQEHAQQCETSSLDFVFLDGSHEKIDVLQDIKGYIDKIKVNGILAGHDIDKSGVADAVKEVFGKDVVQLFGRACWYVRL